MAKTTNKKDTDKTPTSTTTRKNKQHNKKHNKNQRIQQQWERQKTDENKVHSGDTEIRPDTGQRLCLRSRGKEAWGIVSAC